MTLSRSTLVHALALSVVLLSACVRAPVGGAPSPIVAVTTGDQLLRAMHDRYAGKWYRTLTFVQRTVESPPGAAERRSTWLEAMAVPGRLRIDTDLAKGDGTLFARDSQFVIRGNQQRFAVAGHNPLLVLGFDVYAQAPARTAEIVRGLGFKLDSVREDTWQERPVYVVGAPAGDLRSHQIWVDRERLVFVRMLQPLAGDPSKTIEYRFNKYEPLAGGWIAPEVEGLLDGRRTLFEEYTEVRANVPLDDAIFDPRRWSSVPHWRK
jgi:hypothetical protein